MKISIGQLADDEFQSLIDRIYKVLQDNNDDQKNEAIAKIKDITLNGGKFSINQRNELGQLLETEMRTEEIAAWEAAVIVGAYLFTLENLARMIELLRIGAAHEDAADPMITTIAAAIERGDLAAGEAYEVNAMLRTSKYRISNPESCNILDEGMRRRFGLTG